VKCIENKEKVSEVEKYYFTFQPSLRMLLMINNDTILKMVNRSFSWL